MNATSVDFVEKLISLLVAVIGTGIAVSSFYGKKHDETMARYADGQRKAYAAERDFEHLRRNQEQMKEALRLLDDELKNTREDFLEIKGMLTVTLSQSGLTESGILAHRKRSEP